MLHEQLSQIFCHFSFFMDTRSISSRAIMASVNVKANKLTFLDPERSKPILWLLFDKKQDLQSSFKKWKSLRAKSKDPGNSISFVALARRGRFSRFPPKVLKYETRLIDSEGSALRDLPFTENLDAYSHIKTGRPTQLNSPQTKSNSFNSTQLNSTQLFQREDYSSFPPPSNHKSLPSFVHP